MKLKELFTSAGEALGLTPKDCGKKDVVCLIDKLKDRKKKIHHKLAKEDIKQEKFESLKEDEEIIKSLLKKAEKTLEKIEDKKK